MTEGRFSFLAWLVLAAVLAVYTNHFQNGFHFDDSHAVVDNFYIRDLHNIPKFFTDATTFSALPANQTYRPIVSTSLAIDYWLGHGLKPFYFQFSTFLWFLLQLWLMSRLYRRLLDQASPDPAAAAYAALFAAAWYGLHPVMAETVNYVIQRGDVYSTLGVVAGLLAYIVRPQWRKTGLYLIPVALADLAKPPALVFPGILLAYVLLFEESDNPRRWAVALRKCIPAFLVSALMAFVQARMTPKHYAPGIISAHDYIITQPYVALRYFGSFFLPVHLSADTDLQPFTSIFTANALLGFAFVAAVMATAYFTARQAIYRPVSFGLIWFVLAILPTALFPLSEVENDHRMFFPFVGLALSVAWAVRLMLGRAPNRGIVIAAAACILASAASGTRQRNEVWRDEESLWRDVSIKSPHNGRGLMNYGLSLMGRGQLQEARALFERALLYTPNYPTLEINLGVVNGALGRSLEAERHFQRARSLAPMDALPDFFYARWLMGTGRIDESIPLLASAISKNPAHMDARHLLMQAYTLRHEGPALEMLAQDTLRIAPNDPMALSHRQLASRLGDPVTAAESLARTQKTPEHYLDLSLAYHRAKRYQDSIGAAREALRLKPDYAEAYNNIAAAYEDMGRWDEAIQAAQQALRLRPDFQLARNNLLYSEQQKKQAGR